MSRFPTVICLSVSRTVFFRLMATGLVVLSAAIFTSFLNERTVSADTSIGDVKAGSNPNAVAVDPITNKIYVANFGSNIVTVINGQDNTTSTIAVGAEPAAIAIDPVTNKIYVANSASSDV